MNNGNQSSLREKASKNSIIDDLKSFKYSCSYNIILNSAF